MEQTRQIKILVKAIEKDKGKRLVPSIIIAYLIFSEPGDPGQISWSLEAGGGVLKEVNGIIDSYIWNELIKDIENHQLKENVATAIGIDLEKYEIHISIENN